MIRSGEGQFKKHNTIAIMLHGNSNIESYLILQIIETLLLWYRIR